MQQLALDVCGADRRVHPPEPIARAACVVGDYRYWLRRRWAHGPEVMWCMLNPSTADASQDDPTLKRVMGFSYRWGFAGCVVVNLYPYRSPHPAALAAWRRAMIANVEQPDRSARWDAYCRNVKEVAGIVESASMHIAAWGAFEPSPGDRHSVLSFIADELSPIEIDWRCIGVTAGGFPKHPFARGLHRVPDSAEPVLYFPDEVQHAAAPD